MLDLKLAQDKSVLCSPMTRCAAPSSHGSTACSSDEEQENSFDNIIESPSKFAKQANIVTPARKNVKTENTWKQKVKTELCRFWLQGKVCENQLKEQGCGFAHGQEELMKKKTLSRQYLTSVCKNFLEHPSKCTYGARCIFQHPSHDVRERQTYQKMMTDNQRFTAMRLFQEIEGADVFYINTYAASTPRLSVFKGICNTAKDNGEEELSDGDWAELTRAE